MKLPIRLLRLTPLGYNINRAFTLSPETAEKLCAQNLVILADHLDLVKLYENKWFNENYTIEIIRFPYPNPAMDVALFKATKNSKRLIRTIWRLGYPDIAARLTQLTEILQACKK